MQQMPWEQLHAGGFGAVANIHEVGIGYKQQRLKFEVFQSLYSLTSRAPVGMHIHFDKYSTVYVCALCPALCHINVNALRLRWDSPRVFLGIFFRQERFHTPSYESSV